MDKPIDSKGEKGREWSGFLVFPFLSSTFSPLRLIFILQIPDHLMLTTYWFVWLVVKFLFYTFILAPVTSLLTVGRVYDIKE
jgi:hypothetical protein